MTRRMKMASNRKIRGGNNKTDPAVELAELAGSLNLTTLRDNIPMLLKKAEAEAISYSNFALKMLQLEFIARNNRRLTRNLKRSGLPNIIEGLDTYDFSLRPKLEAPLVRELENCRFAEEDGRNIICVGRPGLGKTRILDAIARAACDKGYSVKKKITADLLEELHASLVDGSYARTFKRYEKFDILYLDEFGYDTFDANATKHLFRLVSARHRKRSILLAANTGFKSWKRFFPSEAQAVATVDRLIDQATILRFTGKSFRKPKQILGDDIE
jgi:DNA replication protein DnaC